jgi:hypothetical protein
MDVDVLIDAKLFLELSGKLLYNASSEELLRRLQVMRTLVG